MTRRFAAGTVLFAQDDTTLDLFILMSGKVEVIKEGQIISVIDSPGAFLGEISTLLGQPRSALIRTATASRIVCIPEDQVSSFVQKVPGIGLRLARQLAQRLTETTNTLLQAREIGRRHQTLYLNLYNELSRQLEKNPTPELRALLERHETVRTDLT
ncbi:MAG: cyclic nucleotide-binding domain-containing protein [Candidatus Schekmanbacteria bacterium]|nr:cyclic nucleotide-binding domain-containing protein [Candidatus Schekmanbacteria bacterium]